MIDPIFNSDATYGLAQKFLDAAALRQNAIASNLATAETPGDHRMDVAPDFAAQLKAQMESGQPPSSSLTPTLVQDPTARSIKPDGNNVEIEKELLAMNRNSVEYQYLSNYISSNIKELKQAISGQAGS